MVNKNKTNPKLSLCMIVKNEESSLSNCLDSVKDIVDEMIIVDTGSTDNTAKIAEEYKAKIEHFKWCDDFSKARNKALSYVTGEWVLVLDADEVLNTEIIPIIQQIINNKNNLVINLIRQEIGAAQSPYSLVSRLFRRHPQISFSRPYHSMIDDSVAQLLQQESHWKIINLDTVAIYHYGYQPDTISTLNKATKAKSSLEKFLKQNPSDIYTCSKLAAIYIQEGDIKKGIKLLQKGLSNQKIDPVVKFELHYHLANAYTRNGNLDKAINHYKKAINQTILEQLKLGAYNNLGSVFQAQNKLDKAQEYYQNAIEIDPNFATAYYNLGMTLKAQGNFVEAINIYQKAIKLNPDNPFAYQNLGVALLKIGKIPECLKVFQVAINLHQSQNNPQEAEKIRQGLKNIGFILE
jgi:tetratricopeptide (TPR) repeat protein